MKRILFIGLFTLTFVIVGQETKNSAEEKLKIFLEESQAAGVSAGYAVNGVIVWQSGVGYGDIKAKEPVKTNTKIRMASISKSMTALAAMQLWEAGKLDLDLPIQTYIPDYPKHPKTQITIRHLLSHTSGIAGYKNVKEQNTTIAYPSLTDALSIFKDRELLFEPGTKYSYTTYGYTVLGVIIERVSGMTFEEYIQQHILNRAGMLETGVVKFKAPPKNASKIYHRKGGKGKAREGAENNLSNRIPGGGFYTTVTDMLKFGNAVINNDFVKRETLDFMREHHSLEKELNAYGFGWFLYGAKPNEGELIGHSGAQMGASSQLWIVPDKKVVVVVLANTSRVQVGNFAFELLKMAREEARK